jgi:hypothetical protein
MKIAFCLLLLACSWVADVRAQNATGKPELLAFNEILAPDLTALKPSEKLQRLNGQRVRIHGYMAEFEEPTKGYFYLTPRRVRCDESGNGTGELPVESIRVKSLKEPARVWQHIPAILEIVGVITFGPPANEEDAAADDAGNYAALRLKAEKIYVLQPARRGSTRSRKPSPTSIRRP